MLAKTGWKLEKLKSKQGLSSKVIKDMAILLNTQRDVSEEVLWKTKTQSERVVLEQSVMSSMWRRETAIMKPTALRAYFNFKNMSFELDGTGL